MQNQRNRRSNPPRPASAGPAHHSIPPWDLAAGRIEPYVRGATPVNAHYAPLQAARAAKGVSSRAGVVYVPYSAGAGGSVATDRPRKKGGARHNVRMPEIAALNAVLAERRKSDAPHAPDLAEWHAQVAALRAKFDAYEAPFSHRPRDMHWPPALEADALVLPPDEADVTKRLLGWKGALVKLMGRLDHFKHREQPDRGDADSLVSINGLEPGGFHCNTDVFEHLAAMDPSKVVVRHLSQLILLLPYFLRKHPEWSMGPGDWKTVADVFVGGHASEQDPGPHKRPLTAFVHRLFLDEPERVRSVFQNAMAAERRARKRAEQGAGTALPAGEHVTKASAPAQLLSMGGFY